MKRDGKTRRGSALLLLLSLSLLTVSLTVVLLNGYYRRTQFELLETFCGELIAARPDAEQTVWEILKGIRQRTASEAPSGTESGMNQETLPERGNVLSALGYRPSDFARNNRRVLLIAGAGFLAGGLLLLLFLRSRRRRTVRRIRVLTDDLEKINAGSQGLLSDRTEDDFSKLQDEIYKTVTALYQTRDAALKAKNNFAENLSNIAHQLKTPITAISLSAQMMEAHPSPEYLSQIRRQLKRLTHLEEALLILSRIDAGTLTLKQSPVDVFTLLTLAADNLQDLFEQAGVSVEIPELGAVSVCVDLEWTMEAVMNLLKNCMEHSPCGSTVHCSYAENPLYVELRIQDEGEGFDKEELPHLFERFYRGKTAEKGGLGIGLPLARELFEMQNGILTACNRPSGGACFEIRIYRH